MNRIISAATLETLIQLLNQYKSIIMLALEDAGITGSRASRVAAALMLVVEKAEELSAMARTEPSLPPGPLNSDRFEGSKNNQDLRRAVREYQQLNKAASLAIEEVQGARKRELNEALAVSKGMDVLTTVATKLSVWSCAADALEAHDRTFGQIAGAIERELMVAALSALDAALRNSLQPPPDAPDKQNS